MNKQLMEYKGYKGTVEVSIEDGVLHGSIQFIRDKVTYEADSVDELVAEFHAAVDDYLETCKELSRDPDKPFNGTFQVRVKPEIHRQLAIRGLQSGESLNQMANFAFEQFLNVPKAEIYGDVFNSLVESIKEISISHTREINWQYLPWLAEAFPVKVQPKPTEKKVMHEERKGITAYFTNDMFLGSAHTKETH
jgi:predicted HicB family RNase H-like nuclease